MAKAERLDVVLKDMAALSQRLEAQISGAGSDRIRFALLRVQGALDAVPDAVRTEQHLERD